MGASTVLALGLYRIAAVLLPGGLRGRAEEMGLVFVERVREARLRRGRVAALACAARELGDVIVTALRLRLTHLAGRLSGPRRVAAASSFRPRSTAMEDLLHDLRHALRSWVRQPAFALVTIVTLALGIGANTAIFSVVDAALLERLPYAEPDRLVMLGQRIPSIGMDRGPISYPNWKDWRTQARSFADLAAFRSRIPHNVRFDAGVEQITGSQATGNLFSLLGVDAQVGRVLNEEDAAVSAPRVVVLSHALWQRSYGADRGVLGSSVTIDGEPYTVVGVMPAGFDFPSRFDELWIPFRDDPELDRDLNFLQAVGRLAPNATLASARAEMVALFDRMRGEYPEVFGENQPNLETRRELVSGGVRPMLLLLTGAVALLLLVACANLANLMLIRATARTRELAVRSALGARRGRLLRQLLAEGGLLALAGGAAGIAVALASTRVVLLLAPETLPRRNAIDVDERALAFTLAVSVASAILFALVPALRASRADLQQALREAGRTTPGLRTGRLRPAQRARSCPAQRAQRRRRMGAAVR